MKTLRNIILPVLALTVIAACTQEPLYEKGEEENPDTYGVYFPSQTSSTTVELDPEEATEVTYRVRRTNYLDEITVPVEITVSEDGIFDIEPIHFAAGESETTFKVSFEAAEVGTTYSCTISVTDPKYIKIYSPLEKSLSFTVVRAGWKLVTGPGGATSGKWRDDIIGDVFTLNTSSFNRNPEIDVEIYERDDMPGYYRMKVYGGKTFLNALAGGAGDVNVAENKDSYTYVDARDPQKVYLPLQGTGLVFSSTYGEISFGSYVPDNFSLDETAAQYGTLKDGVITFPVSSIMFTMESMSGSYYTVNTNGATRLILPGYTVPDYTVTLAKTTLESGGVEISATLAADVAKVRYAFFEGTLDDDAANVKAQDLDGGASGFEGEITASGKVPVTCTKTGKYTLVGCVYDAEGVFRDYVSIPFGYVAEGDEVPVDIHFGIEGTNEYAGQGISTDNAGRFYVYGEDIESITFGLYKKSKAQSDPASLLDDSGQDFTEAQLQKVNDKYFSVMLTGLNGDTEYTLVLRAGNGYTTVLLTQDYKTTGTFNPGLETDWSYSSFHSTNPSKSKITSTSWNCYALELCDSSPVRRYIGKVTFSDNDSLSGSGLEMLNVDGLNGVSYDSGGSLLAAYIPDSYQFEGYAGTLALYVDQTYTLGTKDGSTVFTGYITDEDPQNVYMSWGIFFGEVADGYLYGVPSPVMQSEGYTCRYLYTASTNVLYSLMTQIVLVDPENDMGGLPGAPSNLAAGNMTEIPVSQFSISKDVQATVRFLPGGFKTVDTFKLL